MSVNKRAFMIAGTQSGVGKTTLTLGIMAALANKYRLLPFKTGPDYIDTAFHSRVTGIKSRNLDDYLMTTEVVQGLFHHHLANPEIELAIIEGAMGLFDGSIDDVRRGSSASIAKALEVPVVLVVDGSHLSVSAAAIVQGFLNFDPGVKICGVIFNRVGSDSHYTLLKEAVEAHCQLPCFGYLPVQLESLPSRHLGLVSSEEYAELEPYFKQLAQAVEATIDLEQLLEVLENYLMQPNQDKIKALAPFFPKNGVIKLAKPLRLGVAYDKAFHFYYEDNLDCLRAHGVECVPFSPLIDKELPKDLDGLYIGGGYPECYGAKLEENVSLRVEIAQRLAEGMPFIAECGGFMYLTQSITDLEGTSYEMVGFFDGETVMSKSLKGFGYKRCQLLEDCVAGPKEITFNVHEFHHSTYESVSNEACAYSIQKWRLGQCIKEETVGRLKGQGIGGYAHLHFFSHPDIIKSFIHSLKEFKQKEGYIHIYTGNGKGKTTAALGLALRAVGNQNRVLLLQLLKGSRTSELESLKILGDLITVKRIGEQGELIWHRSEEELEAYRLELATYWQELPHTLEKLGMDMLIIDEVFGAITKGLLTEEQLLDLLKSKPRRLEVILTGRHAPASILEQAHLITEMTAVRHYYEQGVKARPGIEF